MSQSACLPLRRRILTTLDKASAESSSSKPQFKHFIITRYCTRAVSDPKDFEARLGDMGEWLDRRLVLFERYCLPSIIAQSEQNFTWLLYFDETAPPDRLQKVRDLIAGHDNIEIRLAQLLSPEDHAADVRAACGPDISWVVTSRLDNDDGWHRDFAKNLHAQLRFEQREFLNFPFGIIYYRDRTYLYRHASNAFISFCEPVDQCLTVICSNHIYADRVARVRQLSGPPAFLQAVHGTNQSNKPRGSRVHRILALNGFEPMTQLFRDSIEESDSEILFENLTAATAWKIRDQIISLVRKRRD